MHMCTYTQMYMCTHMQAHTRHIAGLTMKKPQGVLLFNAYVTQSHCSRIHAPKQFDFQIDVIGLLVSISLSRGLSPNS